MYITCTFILPTGGVKPRAVWWYILCQGPMLTLVWTILLLIFEFLHVFSNIWLALWTGDERLKSRPTNGSAAATSTSGAGVSSPPPLLFSPFSNASQQQLSSGGSWSTKESEKQVQNEKLMALQFYYIAGYGLFTVARVFCNVTHIIAFVFANVRASRIMHHKLLGLLCCNLITAASCDVTLLYDVTFVLYR